MLQELPAEVIYHIATLLPTASALTNLSLTCRRLYGVIKEDNWRIFRAFVQSQFPGIYTPPYWKEAAQALTSRSRALDRYGLVVRILTQPDTTRVGVENYIRHDRPTYGYRAVVDSYEIWTGSSWTERKEVLVWSAAAELLLRIREFNSAAKDKLFRFLDIGIVTSHHDVCGVHLLRPEHPSKLADREHLIFARYNGDIHHVSISPGDGSYQQLAYFYNGPGIQSRNAPVLQTSLSSGPSFILAVQTSAGEIKLYHTTTTDTTVQAFRTIVAPVAADIALSVPTFLAPERLAMTTSKNVIQIYDVVPEETSLVREIVPEDIPGFSLRSGSRMKIHAMTPLNSASFGAGSFGNVFLAGRGTGRIRLHDLRSPKAYEKEYIDTIDANPSYCILPFGHDKFIVGAGADAVLKIFDLRMTTTSYSYTRAALPQWRYDCPKLSRGGRKRTVNGLHQHIETGEMPHAIGNISTRGSTRKDFSIFISLRSAPTKKRVDRRRHCIWDYRGAIYHLSTPSPSSSTVYTGILDGVIRLDFASTDDIIGPNGDWYRRKLALPEELPVLANGFHKSSYYNDLSDKDSHSESEIFNISGYERPEPEYETASAELRSQKSFNDVMQEDIFRERRLGWDRRWKDLNEMKSWRRGEYLE